MVLIFQTWFGFSTIYLEDEWLSVAMWCLVVTTLGIGHGGYLRPASYDRALFLKFLGIDVAFKVIMVSTRTLGSIFRRHLFSMIGEFILAKHV